MAVQTRPPWACGIKVRPKDDKLSHSAKHRVNKAKPLQPVFSMQPQPGVAEAPGVAEVVGVQGQSTAGGSGYEPAPGPSTAQGRGQNKRGKKAKITPLWPRVQWGFASMDFQSSAREETSLPAARIQGLPVLPDRWLGGTSSSLSWRSLAFGRRYHGR